MSFEYVGSASSSVGLTSTSTSVTIPDTVSEGDLLLLGVMSRSEVATPTGWTLLETSLTEPSSSQRQTLFYKEAENTDPESLLSVAQTSSTRLECQVIAYSFDGSLSIRNSDSDMSSEGVGSITVVPGAGTGSLTVSSSVEDGNAVAAWAGFEDDDGEVLYWITASFNLAATSGNTEIFFSSPWVRRGGSSASQRRLGSADLILAEGLARINQAPTLILVDEASEARVSQTPVLVLWGTGSTATSNQIYTTVLSSFPRRRIITITD